MKAKIGYISCAFIIGCCLVYAHKVDLFHRATSALLATQVDTEGEIIVETVSDPESEVIDPRKRYDGDTDDVEGENPVGGISSVIAKDLDEMESSQPAEEKFDTKAKSEAVVRLVHKGVEFLSSHDPVVAFQEFSRSKDFVVGELYIFAYDVQGVCLSHGQDNSLIWKNLINLKDMYGVEIVKESIKEAMNPVNGGWLTYEWKGANTLAYVKKVVKQDKTYIIGSGYYPHSKTDAVENLVKSAVSLFNDVIKHGRPKDEALSTFSYPLGRFVLGDLYLYALSFDGTHVAHGETPGLIGTNGLQYDAGGGRFVNQEIIQKLKDKGSGGVWVEYESKNAPKKAYAERVVDDKGKEYFIACGFYPTADKLQVVNLVKKGYQFMKANGRSRAAKMFSDPRDNTFRYGDLYLEVYDMEGRCIADGRNLSFVGSEQIDAKDEDGQYYVKEMIKKAKTGGGWINYKIRNSFKSSYVEKVTLGVDEYVISSGLYPVSKYETMFLLAKSGADYLKSNKAEIAYNAFVDEHSKFVRGDLFIFAVDSKGVCFSYGPNHHDLIWRNLMNIKDDQGKQFVKALINHTQKGAGTIYYKLNGVSHVLYAEPVEKDGKTIIVGSGYFL